MLIDQHLYMLDIYKKSMWSCSSSSPSGHWHSDPVSGRGQGWRDAEAGAEEVQLLLECRQRCHWERCSDIIYVVTNYNFYLFLTFFSRDVSSLVKLPCQSSLLFLFLANVNLFVLSLSAVRVIIVVPI